jgi:carbon monoxide dehydrogenase subunit G
MEHGETIRLDAPVERVRGLVDDLANYPKWMPLVHAVTRDADASHPVWLVELRARIGPFARSKKLRMQRVVHDVAASGACHVVFDRNEVDGRSHSQWQLEALVSPDGSGSRVDVTLRYSGALFGPVVEAALRHYVAEGRERLAAIATSTG